MIPENQQMADLLLYYTAFCIGRPALDDWQLAKSSRLKGKTCHHCEELVPLLLMVASSGLCIRINFSIKKEQVVLLALKLVVVFMYSFHIGHLP